MFLRLRCWPFALFWLTLTALAAPGCETIPTVTTLPASFTLAPGQTVRAGTGVVAEVRFERVVSDSRCPLNVLCIQAGDAVVALRFTVGSSQAQVELALVDPSRRTATSSGYSVEFTRLDPYPIAGQPTRAEDYRVFITINR